VVLYLSLALFPLTLLAWCFAPNDEKVTGRPPTGWREEMLSELSSQYRREQGVRHI
jgi:hypothetical protein